MTVTDIQQIQTEVLDAFKGLVDACRALDAPRYLDYLDKEKFSGLGADGRVWHSFKDIEDVISAGFATIEKIVSLEFDKVKVTALNASTAILVNEFTQTILLKDATRIEQSGGGSQVWLRSGAAWKLASISASDAVSTDGPYSRQ
jgi:hypothetical protein